MTQCPQPCRSHCVFCESTQPPRHLSVLRYSSSAAHTQPGSVSEAMDLDPSHCWGRDDVAVSLIRLVEPVCTGPVILEEHAKPRHLRGNLTGTSHRCGRTGRPWVSEDVQGLKTVDVRWSWPWWSRCIPLCGPLRNSLLRSVLWLLCREDMTNLRNSLQIRKSVTTKTNGSDSQQGKKKGRPQKQGRESRQGKGRLISSS